jgi:CBS-domain-containing membrane protein
MKPNIPISPVLSRSFRLLVRFMCQHILVTLLGIDYFNYEERRYWHQWIRSQQEQHHQSYTQPLVRGGLQGTRGLSQGGG